MKQEQLLTVQSNAPSQTQAIAAAIARVAEPGDLVLLAGELGAGKTAFAQGFGAALGVSEPITSPTFTIAHRHDGRVPVHHVDAYRLERLHEVNELALGEVLDEGGVVLIEWGDVVASEVPPDHLEISITFGLGNDDRLLSLRPVGPRWSARWRMLQEELAPFTAPAPDRGDARPPELEDR